MNKYIKYLFFFIISLLLIQCKTTLESGRDPAKQGYFMAEQMIKDGRYYDGLLLHRINAKFFADYNYGHRSGQRLLELNKQLLDSVAGRPKIEIIKSEILSSKKEARLSIANNTDKQIQNLVLSVYFLDKQGNRLTNTISGEKEVSRRIGQFIGPWALYYVLFSLDGYDKAVKIQGKIQSYSLREIPLK